MTRAGTAGVIEVAGILAISSGAALFNLALGLISLGLGAILFGVSLERES